MVPTLLDLLQRSEDHVGDVTRTHVCTLLARIAVSRCDTHQFSCAIGRGVVGCSLSLSHTPAAPIQMTLCSRC